MKCVQICSWKWEVGLTSLAYRLGVLTSGMTNITLVAGRPLIEWLKSWWCLLAFTARGYLLCTLIILARLYFYVFSGFTIRSSGQGGCFKLESDSLSLLVVIDWMNGGRSIIRSEVLLVATRRSTKLYPPRTCCNLRRFAYLSGWFKAVRMSCLEGVVVPDTT